MNNKIEKKFSIDSMVVSKLIIDTRRYSCINVLVIVKKKKEMCSLTPQGKLLYYFDFIVQFPYGLDFAKSSLSLLDSFQLVSLKKVKKVFVFVNSYVYYQIICSWVF